MSTIVAGGPTQADTRDEAAWMRAIFAPFETLLEAHLIEQPLQDGGLVSAFDYAGALADPTLPARLERQRQRLAAFDRTALDTRERAVAFWINAYNYFMVDHILSTPARDGLVESVRDYGTLFNPYRVFRRAQFEVGGQRFSLDDIEKGILLGAEFRERGWKDARVHFAVNCASVGCPPLRRGLYLPGQLDTMLAETTRHALNTPRHLRIEGDTLYLSRVFDWYTQDYVEAAGSVEAFIARHADDTVGAALAQVQRSRRIPYDWRLNRPENFPELAERP